MISHNPNFLVFVLCLKPIYLMRKKPMIYSTNICISVYKPQQFHVKCAWISIISTWAMCAIKSKGTWIVQCRAIVSQFVHDNYLQKILKFVHLNAECINSTVHEYSLKWNGNWYLNRFILINTITNSRCGEWMQLI